MHASKIGTSRARSATYSISSMNVGSAHWMSSITKTTGLGGEALEQRPDRPAHLFREDFAVEPYRLPDPSCWMIAPASGARRKLNATSILLEPLNAEE